MESAVFTTKNNKTAVSWSVEGVEMIRSVRFNKKIEMSTFCVTKGLPESRSSYLSLLYLWNIT